MRGQTTATKPRLTLDEFYAQSTTEGPKELSVVLKSDVQGTCEAARDALEKLTTEEVSLRVISSGVGAIVENDINLASASGTIVLGFNVRPDPAARKQADSSGVEIRTYSIIMQMLDEVKAAMAGLLPPVVTENMLGRAEIRETFTIPKLGTIAGSYILEGKVIRHSHCRIVRDGIQVYAGTVGSLRRFKDDVKEVINGMECGIGVATYNDIKVGDVIESFELNERPRDTLKRETDDLSRSNDAFLFHRCAWRVGLAVDDSANRVRSAIGSPEMGGTRMIVGAAVVELRVHESQSLKAKRGVVRSIAGRVRNRFNVSVSEVGGQGTWQKAVIGMSMTGSEEVPLRRALEKAVRFVEETHLAEVVDSEIEMIRLPISALSMDSDEREDDLPWSRDLGEAAVSEEE